MRKAGASRLRSGGSSRIVLTWRLWRALRFPDEGHPLFERVQEQAVELPGRRVWRRLTPIYRIIDGLLPALIVVLAPVALPLVANALGALIAFNVMRVIQRERDGRTYDLLALLPMGLGAANWQIAAACAQRLNAVERLAQARTLAVITLVLLMFYLMRSGPLASLSLLIGFVALNFDAIQSLIVGCLSGMLGQALGERGSPFAALTIFVFVQLILVYLPVTAAAILLLNAALPAALNGGDADTLPLFGLALALLILVFALREAVIRLLWRLLERRLL